MPGTNRGCDIFSTYKHTSALPMAQKRSFDVSFKLKAVDTTGKQSKEAAACGCRAHSRLVLQVLVLLYDQSPDVLVYMAASNHAHILVPVAALTWHRWYSLLLIKSSIT